MAGRKKCRRTTSQALSGHLQVLSVLTTLNQLLLGAGFQTRASSRTENAPAPRVSWKGFVGILGTPWSQLFTFLKSAMSPPVATSSLCSLHPVNSALSFPLLTPYNSLGFFPEWPAGGVEAPLSPLLDNRLHPTRTLSLLFPQPG